MAKRSRSDQQRSNRIMAGVTFPAKPRKPSKLPALRRKHKMAAFRRSAKARKFFSYKPNQVF